MQISVGNRYQTKIIPLIVQVQGTLGQKINFYVENLP